MLWPTPGHGQTNWPPVIDMHVHSTNTSPEAVMERMTNRNVRFVFLSALSPDLPKWRSAIDSQRLLPSIGFPCPGGRAVITGRSCFGEAVDLPDLGWLRREIQAGRIKALGEVVQQYLGMSPNDPRMEPYWRLAEECDIPVAIHMGPGPPGIAYDSTAVPVRAPQYRMSMGDPVLLEEVLLRHKRGCNRNCVNRAEQITKHR